MQRNMGRSTSLNSVLKEAFPNRSYKEIFEIGFYNAKKLLESLPLWSGNSVEILAFLYRIGTLTIQRVRLKDIYSYKAQAIEFIDSIIPEEKELFNKRENFYWEISYGKKILGFWSWNDIPPSIQSNAILRCAVAFGDCVTNPGMIDDYYKAPLLIHDASDCYEFQMRFMDEFFRFVYTFCVMLAGEEFDPPILREYEKQIPTFYNHSDKRVQGDPFDELIKDADAAQHALRNPMEDFFYDNHRIQRAIQELM